jgi:hypothetical protein
VIGTDAKSQLVSADDYEDADLIAVDVNSGMYSLNDSQGTMVRNCLPLVKYMYMCTRCLHPFFYVIMLDNLQLVQ